MKFASLTSDNGCNIVCIDENTTQSIVQNVKKKAVTYALNNKNADYTAENITLEKNGCPTFDIFNKDRKVLSVSLNVAGRPQYMQRLRRNGGM